MQRDWYNNNYCDEQQSFLIVSFIVCLTSLIFQKYRIGFCDAFKDGASFCYCAYVLRISEYSGFLRNLAPNTTIFLRGF